MRLLQWTTIALAILMISSCKIRIVVPEGGSVATQSGAYSCGAGETCNMDVVDFYFDETFIAKPSNGYIFKHWRKGDRRFCGNKRKPCHLLTSSFPADWKPGIKKFLEATDEIFYLQPVFEKKASQSLGGNRLYAIIGSSIVGIDPETGSVLSELEVSGTLDGLVDAVFVKGQLYGIEWGTGYLVRIDQKTGATSDVGNTGNILIGALAHSKGKLYATDVPSFGAKIYEVNLNNGFSRLLYKLMSYQSPNPYGYNFIIEGFASSLDGDFYIVDGYDDHLVRLDAVTWQKKTSIALTQSEAYVDCAFVKNQLICLTFRATLVKINAVTGSATEYAAVDFRKITPVVSRVRALTSN